MTFYAVLKVVTGSDLLASLGSPTEFTLGPAQVIYMVLALLFSGGIGAGYAAWRTGKKTDADAKAVVDKLGPEVESISVKTMTEVIRILREERDHWRGIALGKVIEKHVPDSHSQAGLDQSDSQGSPT